MSEQAHAMNQFLLYAGAVTILAGTIGALGYLARKVIAMVRMLDVIERIVSRELEHNHGTSMKDDVNGMAIAIGKTQRDVDDLKRAWRRHLPDDPMFWKDNK